MVDLLLAGAAVVLLLIVTVVLLRGERPGRAKLAAAVAVIVVAAGTFAVTLYHHESADDAISTDLPNPTPTLAPAASQGLGAAVITVEIPMGTGDKLPQGALRLSPPRAGTDAYTGDLSLLCSTPGKTDHDQNCTGGDRRVWTVEPLKKRAVIAPAAGDPFHDPAACAAAEFQPGYLELAADHAYCVRRTDDPATTFGLRVPDFPADQPLPAKIVVEVAQVAG